MSMSSLLRQHDLSKALANAPGTERSNSVDIIKLSLYIYRKKKREKRRRKRERDRDVSFTVVSLVIGPIVLVLA